MKDTGATAADDLEGAASQAASGTKVAKKNAKEKEEQIAEKQAETGVEAIFRMGNLPMSFADS